MHDFYINDEFPNEEKNALIAGRLIITQTNDNKTVILQTLFDKDDKEELRYINLISEKDLPVFQYYDYCLLGHFDNKEKTRFVVKEAYCNDDQWEAQLSTGEYICCSGFNPYETTVEGKSKVQFSLNKIRINVNLRTLYSENALPVYIAGRNARTMLSDQKMCVYSRAFQLGIEGPYQKEKTDDPIEEEFDEGEENDFI